jgi:hypothetical protein
MPAFDLQQVGRVMRQSIKLARLKRRIIGHFTQWKDPTW